VYVSTDISSQGTGFVTALSPGSGSYIYSTYLGGLDGSDKQFAEAIAVDASGNAYVTGQTASAYYGATPGAVNQGYGGWDIFVTKISQASGSCQISVANSSLLAYGSGGVFPLSIFAPAGCTWTATPNASWVSLFGLSSASGSAGTLALVAGNGGSARSTTISFTTGQSITINQTAGSCSYGFVPSSGLAAASGGGGGANLNVGSGCAWNAVSSEPWLTISNASGSGTSGINYTVAANPDNSNRTATITVSNAIYTLTQSAQSGGCTYTVSPSTFYVGPRGTNANLTGALTVTAPPGCAWSASPSASNISMITGSGTGTGTATYSVAANTSNTTGTGISYSISVTGGASQTVRQASAGDRGNAAVFRSPGQWWMDLNGDYAWIAGTDRVLTYGQPGDIPIVGDWDNTGWYRIGIFRQGQWWLDMNGDGQWTANADIVFNYGEAGDVPVVGDWTYTGVQRIGVFRQGQWWLDINNDHAWTQGVDALYIFGQAGDVPLMGNWDNSGQLKPGIFRQGQWWMSIGGDWNWIGGRDRLVIFGQAGDAPLIGDWTHANDYRIGVFRGGQWWLDINGDFAWTGAPDKLYIYGQAGDTPIVNNWY
jgi:hypothetical protein